MSGLVHDGSRSLTARLIGRVKHNLDEFIAPQASFGYAHMSRWHELVLINNIGSILLPPFRNAIVSGV